MGLELCLVSGGSANLAVVTEDKDEAEALFAELGLTGSFWSL
jgi:hypothetical protein